jgi:hypothetical protein
VLQIVTVLDVAGAATLCDLLHRCCGSTADSWYDIPKELSLRTSHLVPRNIFRVASRLRPRFCSSGLLAAGKLLALKQEAYGAVVSFRRAN